MGVSMAFAFIGKASVLEIEHATTAKVQGLGARAHDGIAGASSTCQYHGPVSLTYV